MVDTNALLSIAFSLIATFTNTVKVPPDSAPHTTSNLAKYFIGAPGYPVEVNLEDRAGNWFRIHRGAVTRFTSRDSFSNAGDTPSWNRFTGDSTLTAREIEELAVQGLQRLTKSGNPLTNISPRVRYLDRHEGKPLP